MIIKKCDRCGKLSEEISNRNSNNNPDGWLSIYYNYRVRYDNESVTYFLCGDCAKKLKINNKPTIDEAKDVSMRLLEIIEEISQYVVEDNQQ